MRYRVLALALLLLGCAGEEHTVTNKFLKQQDRIIKLLGGLVANVAQLNAKIDELRADVVAERGQVTARLAELAAEIQRLRDLIAQGGATPAELDAAIASIDSIRGEIAGIVRAAPTELAAVLENGSLVFTFKPAEPGFETVIQREVDGSPGTWTDELGIPGDIPPRGQIDVPARFAGTVRWRAAHIIDGAQGPASAVITTVDGAQQ